MEKKLYSISFKKSYFAFIQNNSISNTWLNRVLKNSH